jgi:hypothetical protein
VRGMISLVERFQINLVESSVKIVGLLLPGSSARSAENRYDLTDTHFPASQFR